MMHLAKLKETNMNRILDLGNQYGYMLISAYRQPDEFATPREIELQNKENNKNSDYLEKEISYVGLSFVPVYGGYHEIGHEAEEEKSYFILNMQYKNKKPLDMDIFLELGLEWCDEYNQDSVLIFDPEVGKPRYYTKDGKIDTEFSGKMSFNDLTKVYYTSLRKGDKSKGKADRRFTYESYVPRYDTVAGKHSHSSKGEIILLSEEFPHTRSGWLN